VCIIGGAGMGLLPPETISCITDINDFFGNWVMKNRKLLQLLLFFSICYPNYLMGENKAVEHYNQGTLREVS